MPHLALVAMSGIRVVDEELLSVGLTLPGLRARGQAIAELPALGLLTLAGRTPDSWTQSYHLAPDATDAVVEAILATRPALVALSALTASVNAAYALSERLCRAGVKTVLGGLHATALPDEAARYVSSVCLGDGEPVWHQILADAAAGELKPRYTATSWAFPETAELPRWDLLQDRPLARYTLQTQRGCPLACSFCAASRLLGPFREKPISAIRSELAAIRAHSSSPRVTLELSDDNTFAGPRPLDEFWQTFAETGMQWFTESDWRIGERPEVYQNLRRAGCRQVLMGVESLVFRYPGMGDKHTELERLIESVHRIQEHGVAVNACLIVGGDGETRASLDRLARFLESAPFADVQLTLQTPYPGTGLYRQLQRQGRILTNPGDWTKYTLFDVTWRPDLLSPAELRSGFLELLARVYGPELTRRRLRIRSRIDRTARPGRLQMQSEDSP